ncbi:hypothetical protein E2C01_086347 [Portunus trituberculatus]|uniref:Uncharacterized protein n=1 Tax=Portunus trituberculatus TaxID=210409 RepID=A0A5B7J3K0_PORTR|nr:hypothetical protein [Portunus trituberculatus]
MPTETVPLINHSVRKPVSSHFDRQIDRHPGEPNQSSVRPLQITPMKSQCDHQCGTSCLPASPRTIHLSTEFMESRQETPHNRLLRFHDLPAKFCRPAPHRHPIMTFLYQTSKGGEQVRHTRRGSAGTASACSRKDD